MWDDTTKHLRRQQQQQQQQQYPMTTAHYDNAVLHARLKLH